MAVKKVKREYNAAVRKVQGTDRLPPKVLFALRGISSCFGLCLSIFLIIIGLKNRRNCEADSHIPYWLIVTGIVIFVSALNFPFYLIGWRKAKNAMAPEEPTKKDIRNATPLQMHRISKFTFICLCVCIPIGILWTLKIYRDHDNCDYLTYWTAFTVSVLYLFWMALMVMVCTIGCLMVGTSHVSKRVTATKEKKQRNIENAQTV